MWLKERIVAKLINLKHERTQIILKESWGVGLEGCKLTNKPGLIDMINDNKDKHEKGYYDYFSCCDITGTLFDFYIRSYETDKEGNCIKDSICATWHGHDARNTQVTDLYFVTTPVVAKIQKLNKRIDRIENWLL